ncbi:hypothetical protein [Arenibaculum sp.]|jgi:hypothetical protein|nr:hypothetical protein [Arenibaculum sp.]
MGYYKYGLTPFDSAEQGEARETPAAEMKLTEHETAEVEAE